MERVRYVTTAAIPKHRPGCFIAKTCGRQGVYKDTPAASFIRTWRRDTVSSTRSKHDDSATQTERATTMPLGKKRSMLWLAPPSWDSVRHAPNASELAVLKANLSRHKDAITVIGTVGYSINPTAEGWWEPNNPGVSAFNREMRSMGFAVHPLIGGLCGDNAECMRPLCGNLSVGECQIKYHLREINRRFWNVFLKPLEMTWIYPTAVSH